MQTRELPLDDIRIDGGTQPRAAIDTATVNDYAAALEAGATFPPVDVFYDGKHYWLADGFHRWHAANAVSRPLMANIRTGTVRDAILFSVGCNGAHGLRQTNEDKRQAVLMLLNDEEWTQWSNREIGKRCGVSDVFVGSVRKTMQTVSVVSERKFTTSTGKTATRKMPEPAAKPDSEPEPAPEPDESDAPEPVEEPPAKQSGGTTERRGVGVERAHQAIAVLKGIPKGDALRRRALEIVSDWIKHNK